jgi:glucose/arabinose dehydrogenase
MLSGWECIADGLDFPTSLARDDRGRWYIGESGLGWDGSAAGGRVLRLLPDGDRQLVIDGLRAPVNGLTWHAGAFLVSEGGNPGRISRVWPDGRRETVLDDLPGGGNYHTCMCVPGPDGKLYFSQGAMTNLAVVGLDALTLGWLKTLPHPQDIPGYDIELADLAIATEHPLKPGETALTGAFAQFGERHPAGTRIPGRVPCTASVMRCNPDGSGLELVAWGLRNTYGLGFLPDGRLLATEQGPDDRGSRPIGNVPETLYEVKASAWYGWPDFSAGRPVTDPAFKPSRGPQPGFALANHAELPPPETPLVELPCNASAVKLAVLPDAGPWPRQLLVCLFGDERPMTAPPGGRAGRTLIRIDPADWSVHRLAAIPADAPLLRPIDVQADADGRHAYVLDFGDFEMDPQIRVAAHAGTGKLWKIRLVDGDPS